MNDDLAAADFSLGTILVVDDQKANIHAVGTLLRGSGYDVMSATSAELALQRMEAKPPDLILLDVMMPGVSGLDLCRRVRGTPKWSKIPIIFLSAVGEVEMITAGLEAGAMDYVTKPFHKAELLSRVRTHLALKASREELIRLAADREELLGVIAHEIKNRLAALQFQAGFMARMSALLAPEIRSCASAIESEAAAMATTIRELLANQSALHQPLIPLTIDVLPLVREIAAAMDPLAKKKDQMIHCFIDPNIASLCVTADGQALRMVVRNVLSNAVKFSPHGTHIFLSVEPEPDRVLIHCADEGPGFTEEDRQRLFSRYGRLSAKPTGGESSTGLGLHIVNTLLRRMGGTIEVNSRPRMGSAFTIKLPVAGGGG